MTEKQDSGGIKGGIATDDNKKAKATAAIPMAVTLVAAALLLSGLSLISSYQPALAQGNMTGGGGSGDGATTTTDNATSTTTTTTITDGAAQGENATNATSAGGAVNQSTSEVRMNIEQARMALQNNDTQGAMMYLDMALSALGGDGAAGTQGNMTTNTTIAGSNAITTGSQNGIPPVGGTSAADEDNEIAEEDDEDVAADGNNNNNDDDDADDRSSSTNANRPETDTEEEEEEDSECGGVTVGGTSAADDYGCPPDPDY
ncbi:MAG: hypothetical protein M3136_11060 [Thermoproteota archaeon]|nr:hypothetical protein [Thermoproteota archaeon]